MKRLILLSILCFQFALVNAQLGTATDFTVTDINGNEHNLYNILDSGKAVVLECSTTWCPPCWSLHQSGIVKDLYAKYGPDGLNVLEVIFYEADADTNSADLNGTGTSTQGDWVTGVPFPIVDEEVLTLDGNLYWPLGYPTVNLIRPSDREIIADMWDYSFDQMDTALEELVASEQLSSLEEELLAEGVKVFPNPASQFITIESDLNVKSIDITNTLGQTVKNFSTPSMKINVADLNTGEYFIRMTTTDNLIVNKKFTKQ